MEKHSVTTQVCKTIGSHSPYKVNKIDPDSDLRDFYGIDSIALVEVLVDVEVLFGIKIDTNLFSYENFSTCGQITDYVCKKLGLLTS